jgi:hypothetical protein
MLADMEMRPAGRRKKNPSHDGIDLPPSLADLGISLNQSSRWQKLAELPEETFERAVAGAAMGRGGGDRLAGRLVVGLF